MFTGMGLSAIPAVTSDQSSPLPLYMYGSPKMSVTMSPYVSSSNRRTIFPKHSSMSSLLVMTCGAIVSGHRGPASSLCAKKSYSLSSSNRFSTDRRISFRGSAPE